MNNSMAEAEKKTRDMQTDHMTEIQGLNERLHAASEHITEVEDSERETQEGINSLEIDLGKEQGESKELLDRLERKPSIS